MVVAHVIYAKGGLAALVLTSGALVNVITPEPVRRQLIALVAGADVAALGVDALHLALVQVAIGTLVDVATLATVAQQLKANVARALVVAGVVVADLGALAICVTLEVVVNEANGIKNGTVIRATVTLVNIVTSVFILIQVEPIVTSANVTSVRIVTSVLTAPIVCLALVDVVAVLLEQLFQLVARVTVALVRADRVGAAAFWRLVTYAGSALVNVLASFAILGIQNKSRHACTLVRAIVVCANPIFGIAFVRATFTLVLVRPATIANPTGGAAARAGEDELDICGLFLTSAMLTCKLILVLLTSTVGNLFGTVLAFPIRIACALV